MANENNGKVTYTKAMMDVSNRLTHIETCYTGMHEDIKEIKNDLKVVTSTIGKHDTAIELNKASIGRMWKVLGSGGLVSIIIAVVLKVFGIY